MKKILVLMLILFASSTGFADELSGKVLYKIYNFNLTENGSYYAFLVGKYTFNNDGTFKFEQMSSLEDKPKTYSVTEYTLTQKDWYFDFVTEGIAALIKINDDMYMLCTPAQYNNKIRFHGDTVYWLVDEAFIKQIQLDNPSYPVHPEDM